MRWAGTKIMSVKPSLTNQNYTQNTHAVKGQVCREIVHIPELKKTFTFGPILAHLILHQGSIHGLAKGRSDYNQGEVNIMKETQHFTPR